MGYYKSDEERIEQLSEEVAEAERKIDDLRDEVSAQTARAEEAEASLAEREALLHECNAVCLCGCPESEHESYGEDGESCGHDDHECLRVPRSVLAYVETLRRAPVRDEVREAAEDRAHDSLDEGTLAVEEYYDAETRGHDTESANDRCRLALAALVADVRALFAILSRDAKGGE